MSARLGNDLFHPDGCVRANVRVQTYMVVYRPRCDHTKVRGAIVMVDAESESSARWYAETILRIPQQTIIEVSLLAPPHPARLS